MQIITTECGCLYLADDALDSNNPKPGQLIQLYNCSNLEVDFWVVSESMLASTLRGENIVESLSTTDSKFLVAKLRESLARGRKFGQLKELLA